MVITRVALIEKYEVLESESQSLLHQGKVITGVFSHSEVLLRVRRSQSLLHQGKVITIGALPALGSRRTRLNPFFIRAK